MKRFEILLLLAICLSRAGVAEEAKTTMSLLLSHQEAQPGQAVTAALQIKSETGWHTYWRNPGDAGMAPAIQWSLPAGVEAGVIAWPVPQMLVLAGLRAYVYEGETLLLIPLKLANHASKGTVEFKGTVEWLECSDKNCVPQTAKIGATLTIGEISEKSAHATAIENAQKSIPEPSSGLNLSVTWEDLNARTKWLTLEWNASRFDGADFYPFDRSVSIGPESEILEGPSGKARLRKSVVLEDDEWPERIEGILVQGQGNSRRAFEVKLDRSKTGKPFANAAPVQVMARSGPSSMFAILALAFLGGLILNVMPCVLPVVALKILGFVNQGGDQPKRVRQLGLIYMLGVLASFAALAAGLLVARRAAGDVNWGMQMQNPYFVVGMLVLVTLVSLNLWGVFEISLPNQALGPAGELASREGRWGAFYNGVLATLLATPCTAPALGAAVGAVLTRPAHIVIITFLTIGFGLALPYAVLAWNPVLLKFLPKPGAWMEKFKIAMGFPLAATAVWLWSFGGKHFGSSGGLWLGIFLLFVALAAWIYGEFVQRGGKRRGWAMAAACVIFAVGYTFTLERSLNWRNVRAASALSDGIESSPAGIHWKRWSPEAVAQARAAGHPVLIDFTADWCFTCQVNKRVSIETEAVARKLKEIDAVAFMADFTQRDAQIGAAIRGYGRAGVPLVVVLPADPAKAPILLPEGPFGPGQMVEALQSVAVAAEKSLATR